MLWEDCECRWCHRKKSILQGEYREGYWICYTCFPQNAGKRDKAIKCSKCKKKKDVGSGFGKKFICEDCDRFHQLKNQPSSGKNGPKKKAKVYLINNDADIEAVRRHQQPQPVGKKRKNKERKSVRYLVHLTEISCNNKL